MQALPLASCAFSALRNKTKYKKKINVLCKKEIDSKECNSTIWSAEK